MKRIAQVQFTITDLSDPVISSTAPPQPVTDTLWLDTSTTPNALKRWDGTQWTTVNPAPDDYEDWVEKTETNTTDIKTANGKIELLVSQTTSLTGAVTSLEQSYSKVTQEVNSINLEVSKIQEASNKHAEEITSIKTQQSNFQVSLKDITATVTQTTKEVTANSTAISSLTSKVTQDEKEWTAAFEVIGADGFVKKGKTTISATGLTVYDGALTVKNKAGLDVMKADADGYLNLAGTFTQYNESGEKAVEIAGNQLSVYARSIQNPSQDELLGCVVPYVAYQHGEPLTNYGMRIYSPRRLVLGGAFESGEPAIEINKDRISITGDIDWQTGKLARPALANETGTSGNWRFRKWSNGDAECWTTVKHEELVSNPGMGGYETTVKLPLTFTDASSMVVTATAMYRQGTPTACCMRVDTEYLIIGVSDTASGLKISVHVTGRWK